MGRTAVDGYDDRGDVSRILPRRPVHVDKKKCGICESQKIVSDKGVVWCPHCDEICPTGTGCGICKSGMKGLPEYQISKSEFPNWFKR